LEKGAEIRQVSYISAEAASVSRSITHTELPKPDGSLRMTFGEK